MYVEVNCGSRVRNARSPGHLLHDRPWDRSGARVTQLSCKTRRTISDLTTAETVEPKFKTSRLYGAVFTTCIILVGMRNCMLVFTETLVPKFRSIKNNTYHGLVELSEARVASSCCSCCQIADTSRIPHEGINHN